ncbi:DUF3592 domain-containing protein [Clostridium saccharobutylicum]|uniref:DUF3592 domain-containing protein n=1 Tax=Clostridium saccharobutylicum DSM 13864 TaxID=1345695 RepID=U5MP53_CLOSA|nr:DUF3592 domain-containing protein [Clostridium saccharobutylicum]AGX42308.1 hypothetical protein CLSA_c13050 [Clostridium saccharobutylicum DSM 13864]AQR89589.1 hypothetical protein CLOSC_12920 [Clostridium saccharobutylicum]AQR99491.1 hypothetical protein CSACC_13000 [Clostridium saccharobutylicum]AQS13477.1 hypothetical protein CLOSACC_13000 [Clostridium saccharobutylicum]MBA2904333.1 hypothetical protein [Clostridium saccharobutylicum]
MVSILLISIGITFIILGIMIFIDKLKLLRTGVRTEGEVVDFEKKIEASISEEKEILYITVYKPIIRFKAENGAIRTITYDAVNSNKIYKIGDKVTLIYKAEELENVEINDIQNIFGVLCKLIAMGIIFIIFALVLSLV